MQVRGKKVARRNAEITYNVVFPTSKERIFPDINLQQLIFTLKEIKMLLSTSSILLALGICLVNALTIPTIPGTISAPRTETSLAKRDT
jgi:hypothetical protein